MQGTSHLVETAVVPDVLKLLLPPLPSATSGLSKNSTISSLTILGDPLLELPVNGTGRTVIYEGYEGKEEFGGGIVEHLRWISHRSHLSLG
jgi:hypothetical protein